MSVHHSGTGCQGPEAGRAPGNADISKVEVLRGPFEHGAVRLTVELDLLQTTRVRLNILRKKCWGR